MDFWQLVPRQQIFGSDELSALSPGIAELSQPCFIEISSEDAARLGVSDGDGITLDETSTALEVRLNDLVAPGCATFGVGLAGSGNLVALSRVSLSRAENWKRRSPELIGTDGGTRSGGAHD